jgi:hypothetical protein
MADTHSNLNLEVKAALANGGHIGSANNNTVAGALIQKSDTVIINQTNQQERTGSPIIPLANSQKSKFNADNANTKDDIQMVDMGKEPVSMSAKGAKTDGTINMIHTANNSASQIDAVTRLLQHQSKKL